MSWVVRLVAMGLLALLVLAGKPAFAVVYQADDGSFESSVVEFGGFRSLVLFQYSALPGGGVVESLSAIWGVDPGLPVDLLLYEDPDDDGNPDDAQLLAAVSVTTGALRTTDTFTIPPTPVAGSFFVAIDFPNVDGVMRNFLAADVSSMPGRGWIARAAVDAPFDRTDLLQNPPPLSFTANFGGDFVPGLRANGENVVLFGGSAYELVPGAISFEDARLAAEARSLSGVPGHLAVLTSSAENDFVANAFSGLASLAWIGASDSEENLAWRWIAGPEAATRFWQGLADGRPVAGRYSNWGATEPNDLTFPEGREDFAQLVLDPAGVFGVLFGRWLDGNLGGSPRQSGYVVEYELADRDADGRPDAGDGCPHTPDPGQLDTDGNGVGDACQCGDVSRDGRTDVSDALDIARGEVPSGSEESLFCDVSGDGLCDVADALEIARGDVSSSAEDQVCAAYQPVGRFGSWLRDVDIAGQGTTATVVVGDPFTVDLDFAVWNAPSCPGCIAQIVLGVDADGQDCAVDIVPGPYPGASGSTRVTLTAPLEPGTYPIRSLFQLQFRCVDAVSIYDAAPPRANVIGTIVVVAGLP